MILLMIFFVDCSQDEERTPSKPSKQSRPGMDVDHRLLLKSAKPLLQVTKSVLEISLSVN